MFDIGFSELLVIGVVALVVIGPERLPAVARTIGLWVGRIQRYMADVKADISREMQLEELRRLQDEVRDSARKLEDSVRAQMSVIESDIGSAKAAVAELEHSLKTGQVHADTPLAESPPEADSLQMELDLHAFPPPEQAPSAASVPAAVTPASHI